MEYCFCFVVDENEEAIRIDLFTFNCFRWLFSSTSKIIHNLQIDMTFFVLY